MNLTNTNAEKFLGTTATAYMLLVVALLLFLNLVFMTERKSSKPSRTRKATAEG